VLLRAAGVPRSCILSDDGVLRGTGGHFSSRHRARVQGLLFRTYLNRTKEDTKDVLRLWRADDGIGNKWSDSERINKHLYRVMTGRTCRSRRPTEAYNHHSPTASAHITLLPVTKTSFSTQFSNFSRYHGKWSDLMWMDVDIRSLFQRNVTCSNRIAVATNRMRSFSYITQVICSYTTRENGNTLEVKSLEVEIFLWQVWVALKRAGRECSGLVEIFTYSITSTCLLLQVEQQ